MKKMLVVISLLLSGCHMGLLTREDIAANCVKYPVQNLSTEQCVNKFLAREEEKLREEEEKKRLRERREERLEAACEDYVNAHYGFIVSSSSIRNLIAQCVSAKNYEDRQAESDRKQKAKKASDARYFSNVETLYEGDRLEKLSSPETVAYCKAAFPIGTDPASITIARVEANNECLRTRLRTPSTGSSTNSPVVK